jgi:hypothetical protein
VRRERSAEVTFVLVLMLIDGKAMFGFKVELELWWILIEIPKLSRVSLYFMLGESGKTHCSHSCNASISQEDENCTLLSPMKVVSITKVVFPNSRH